MSYGINYDEAAQGSDLLPEGEYEVIIKYAGEDATKRGTVYINVTMVIRNDVDQKFKNKYLWYSIWKRKEPSPADLAFGGYSSKQIQTLFKSAGVSNGKQYETLRDMFDDLKDRVVRVTVKHEEYNDETQARVAYVNESKFKDCHHVYHGKDGTDSPAQTPATAPDATPNVNSGGNGDFVEISGDDDLPF